MTVASAGGPGHFGIVGSGWRTRFFLRMARLMPERFEVTAVITRSAGRGHVVEQEWGVRTYRTIGALLEDRRPEFIVVSVPREAAPAVTEQIVAHEVRVLSETPPAPDARGLRDLWAAVGGSGLVQVAEQ